MDPRSSDRGEREFGPDRDVRRDNGRVRYNQHDHERGHHRQADRDHDGRRGWQREDEGGIDRFDRGRMGEEPSMRGRYQYGPEEDRGQWRGDRRFDDREGNGSRSRPGDPRHDEPWRSPGHRDRFDWDRRDSEHARGVHERERRENGRRQDEPWRGDPRGGDWRDPRYDDVDQGRRDWRERMDSRDNWRGERERFDHRRHPGGGDDRFRRGQNDEHRGRDIAATWRRFDEWDDTSWTARRDSGIGFRRAPDGGGRFWESPGADRDDE